MDYTSQTKGDVFTLDLSGELTAFAHEDFRRLIGDASNAKCKECVLNLEDLDFIDSGGLGMLLLAKDELAKHNTSLKLRAPQGNVDRVLRVAKFDQLIPIE